VIVVYVAGAYKAPTSWQREQNVRRAENAALEIAKLGASPLCPHTNTRFFEGECTPEFWYEATMELLRRCDAIFVIGSDWQQSEGTVREVEEATRLKKPVFFSLWALEQWVNPGKRD